MEFVLRCNDLKCRSQLHDSAVVTTCRSVLPPIRIMLILIGTAMSSVRCARTPADCRDRQTRTGLAQHVVLHFRIPTMSWLLASIPQKTTRQVC
jgi:hypothetical protein